MSTPATTATALVTVRYFAAARAAAGVDTEPLGVPGGGSVADLLESLRARHGAEFARVLERCSFLLDEVAVRDRTIPLPDGATLDVLPPFAGG
ncbi:MoaD/ThiS family protein [Pseudonocardia sp. GCM10023141]|uniref:MoaD/ThiS family protein n=1 Tax=Pseudonocardia sp. GCM10023141 TaxID=3252653 RepID=UPI003618652A